MNIHVHMCMRMAFPYLKAQVCGWEGLNLVLSSLQISQPCYPPICEGVS